ncbi:MAG: DUF1016 N-terminal domain-containing protein, partial [Bacteroidota bacterium]|nr:DUF1016 N-terminal domain-containing protein [Bacteroidota bacterium]
MTKIDYNIQTTDFYNKVAELLKNARKSVAQTVNRTMVYTYFEIGRMIVEEEQNGKERAEYGKQILKELSNKLNTEFGKGFSVTNLQQMKNFYTVYRKQQTLSVKSKNGLDKTINFQLSWSHYLSLLRIDNLEERKFYEIEAIENNWSLRELRRQF